MTDQLGLIAVIIMVGAYAFEARHTALILFFAFGCALAAIYAWLIGSIPFVFAEGIWALIACWRWYRSQENFGNS